MASKLLLAALFAAVAAYAQEPQLTADAIMARVAAHQDAAETARARFVYVQHAKVTSRRGKTVRCEEITDTRITPSPEGQTQMLLKLDGRVLYKGRYVSYTSLNGPSGLLGPSGADPDTVPTKAEFKKIDDDTETDRDLAENIRKNLTDAKSKDGIASHLFPLTTEAQKDLTFKLVGHELKNGRDAFHITFEPRQKDEFGWKGDAWIDTTAFQPIVVRTAMSRKIPFAIRALAGIDVPGLGFTAIYAPEPEPKAGQRIDPDHPPVWFPVSFGTEFGIRVFWFFNREIVLSVENRDFEQTHTRTTLVPDEHAE